MHFSYFTLLVSLVSLAVAQDTNLKTVKAAFEAADIPADIDITFDPSVLLEVTFPQTTGPPITLHAGVQLPRNATVGPPSFRVVGAASKGPFVVTMVDPDAPTPQDPTEAEIRHFLGGDFTASGPGPLSSPHLLVNSTPAISNFLQPTPPAGSDPHRYILLLFNQPANFDSETAITASSSIENFNISMFASVIGLGSPIGGTFMRVGPDPTTA